MNHKKLPLRMKIAYSFGQFSDSIPFNLFYTYFLYFLTDVAGIPAALGGAISLIVVLGNAIMDPIVGYLSDSSSSKYGRRRPFMFVALIPLFLCTILLFTTVGFGETGSFIYYLVMGVLFWAAYSSYVIPFFALGAELTQDFDDRNTLRSIAGYALYIAVWIVTAGPMAVLDRTLAAGGTEKTAWLISAVLFGGLAVVGALICLKFTKGKEIVDSEDYQESSKGNLISNYIELFKLKTVRMLLFMIIFYCISFSVATAAFVYLLANNLELGAAQQAFYWTCYSVITIAIIPICNITANIFGKRQAMLGLNLISVAGCFFYYIVGIPNFTHLIIFTVLFSFGNVCFWTIGYSLTYDCCELDEFVNGKRREGAITGFASFMQKLGSAIGMYATGFFLSMFGYDGAAQTQTAESLNGIVSVNTLIPGICTLVGIVFLLMYPINKSNFTRLMEANELKKKGLPYSTEGFEKLLK